MVSWEEPPLVNSFDKVFMGAAGTPTGPPVDDEFNRVSFLSLFDGANNGVNNAFDDGSTSNHTITANGNVTQGSFNPYGTNWAVDFSKDTNPRLSCGSSSDFTFGTGDFTVEFFVFFYSLTSYQTPMSAGYNDSGGMSIQTGNANGKFTFYSGGSAKVAETTSDAEANKWYHIAFSRQSGTLRVFRNGVQTGTASDSTNLNRVGNILIGSDQDFNIDGLLSNFRLVKGTSLYNSNFTPPASALTAVTNTTLLTLQSNRFVDNSASGHTVSPNTGKETIGSFGPFLTDAVYDPAVNGASLSTPAAGDYLSFGNIGLDGHSGDFSIEAWIYPTSYSLYSNTIYGQGGSGSVSDLLEISLNSSGQPHAFINQGSVTLQSTFVCPKNAWTFVQLKRTSGTLDIFINGVQSSTVSNTATIGSPNRGFVGTQSYDTGVSTRSFFGFICDVRVSVVTRSISLPTAPLAVTDSNTKLLLNMADGQAIDSAAQNNLTLAGNAKISTSVKKFGATSLFLDGGTSECFARYPQQGGGTGDFTIEFWIYGIFNNDQVKTILDGRSSGDTSHFMLAQESNNTWLVLDSAGGTVASGWDANTFSNNTWTHVAISRASGTTKYFIDGTQTASVSDTSNWVAGDFTIGGRYTSSATNISHNGYIDDFRVSMMARYTGNFTAPSAAFPDKGQ